jgi:hypothetical protein
MAGGYSPIMRVCYFFRALTVVIGLLLVQFSILENLSHSYEQEPDRRPAVLAPPIYEDEISDEVTINEEGEDTVLYLPPSLEAEASESLSD